MLSSIRPPVRYALGCRHLVGRFSKTLDFRILLKPSILNDSTKYAVWSRLRCVKLTSNRQQELLQQQVRQTPVKLAVNHFPATGPSNSRQISKTFCSNRSVKLASMSRQIGNKNLIALGLSNSRQTRVKLAGNHYPATGPSNSRQIGNKPFSSNRSVKLASNWQNILQQQVRQTRVYVASNWEQKFNSIRSIKLMSNSRQIGSKPLSSNRSIKLASTSRQTCTCNFSSILCMNTCIFM
jgi:hypothetical protein